MDREYEKRYYLYRQIFSNYILIYKSILINKNISLDHYNKILKFIILILEKHYFLNDYVIEDRDDMFYFIKFCLINY